MAGGLFLALFFQRLYQSQCLIHIYTNGWTYNIPTILFRILLHQPGILFKNARWFLFHALSDQSLGDLNGDLGHVSKMCHVCW